MGGKFERSERLEHQTLGVQRLAVRSEDYWEYKPEQRVQTIDGVTGVVKHVEDGPFPGSEEYEVVLDRGLGGGRYTASQLSPAPITAEAMEQTAAVDYPELSQILVERPDPARQFVTAAKANPFAKNDDGDDEEPDGDSDDDKQDDSQDDSHEGDDDSDDKGSGKDDDSDDSDDDGDDAPPWAKKASALFSDLVVTAATDADFRFHVTAAWRDVVAKAKRIRSEGRLRVTMASDGLVFAEVKGDHHVYETGLQRMPGKVAAHSWSCGCKWGAYHWGADDDFSRFAGRMCSHALALQYEAQSRGMFGRDVHVDEHKPTWVPRHVVVRYDIDADTNRLAPSTARKTAMPSLYHSRPEGFQSGYRKGYTPETGFATQGVGEPHKMEGYLNGQLAGHIYFHRFQKGDRRKLQIEELHTEPGVRGHGVASAMMDDLITQHPHHMIDHGERSEDGTRWWNSYQDPAPERDITSLAVLPVVARAAVAAGEDRAEIKLALRTVTASWDDDEDEDGPTCETCGDPFWHGQTECDHCGGEHHTSCCDYDTAHTDWDEVYPHLDGVHRGFAVNLPSDVHAHVHDPQKPVRERAHKLLDAVADGNSGFGMHWSSKASQAEHYAHVSHPDRGADGGHQSTQVVLHAKTPARDDIETDHDTLFDRKVIGYDKHDDHEVPIQEGADVHVKGISWKEPHRHEWTRHDFDKPVTHLANADSPFGDPAGTSYVQPKTPGATAPRKAWENPASAGPLAGADPAGWNRQLPLQSYSAHGGLEAALFEPGGTEAELHDEPEGALPSTDGSVPTDEASDLTPSMTAGLKRHALKDFTLAEQQALINEGEGVRAANLDRLDIKGTHYADLEHVLAAQEEDATWLA